MKDCRTQRSPDPWESFLPLVCDLPPDLSCWIDSPLFIPLENPRRAENQEYKGLESPGSLKQVLLIDEGSSCLASKVETNQYDFQT